jgi:hypothetical protein
MIIKNQFKFNPRFKVQIFFPTSIFFSNAWMNDPIETKNGYRDVFAT